MSGDAASIQVQTLVLAGHVDHGKSTLLGRLLHELGQLPDGKAKELAEMSARRGVPLEWSFVLDGLQAERDQAITLDTTRVRVRTGRREFVVIDAPGHKELLKNMIGGASAASAALLVVDADIGGEEQTLRHAYLLRLLGVREVIVAVNKIDTISDVESVFAARAGEFEWALERMGLHAHAIVPVSAREGTNLRDGAALSEWYRGPTLVQALDSLPLTAIDHRLPLRIAVQDVYRFDDRRILAGRIESGQVAVGDTLVFSPSERIARVAALPGWPTDSAGALVAGDNASIVLDRPLVVERGEIASHEDSPPKLTSVFDADVFWLAPAPLVAGRELDAQIGTRAVRVRVQALRHRIDVVTLEAQPVEQIRASEVGRITLRAGEMLALDDFAALPATGRFVLRDGFTTVGGGVIDTAGHADQRSSSASKRNLTPTAHQVREAERAQRFGHAGAVVWLTGLSASGKSTLAMTLERRLFDSGHAVFVLDGDNIRRGLNANLGFSPEDRGENIRRVGEAAALFAEAGMICITAFISPYRDDRRRARAALPGGRFFEVYVKADLRACESRDPKGLYRRARRGELKDFTGIDSPYEEPVNPDLVIDTTRDDVAGCVAKLLAFVTTRCRA
ncbi:MAG: adenylyl-sulfate kinase [Betaproteobacteria bacterium]